MKVTNSGANCAADALFFATQLLHARRAEECLEYRPAGSIDRWRALHAVRGNRSSLGTTRGQFHFRYIYVPLNPIPDVTTPPQRFDSQGQLVDQPLLDLSETCSPSCGS
jgi:hypothetical protein